MLIINKKELRIGNLVDYPLIGIRPVESGADIDLAYEAGGTPIPITPEWLEKFGFEKQGDWYQIRKLGETHCLNYSIKHSAYSISKDSYEDEEVGFKGNLFVHQLQNIYYWFTLGEELTIKVTL